MPVRSALRSVDCPPDGGLCFLCTCRSRSVGSARGARGTDFVRNALPFPFAGCSHGGLRTPPVLADRPALPFLLGARCVESRAEGVCL